MKEKQKLAGMYQEALREEQGKLLWKDRKLKELEQIIGTAQDECRVWKARFATIVRGGQDLSFLLARAKNIADVFSTPSEIHKLFEYCNNMIELTKEMAQRS